MKREEAYTESFARIYDDIMGAVPYDLWYKYLQELLTYYHKNPDKILDLACGTGNISIRFALEGKQVTGVDKSGDMLNVARDKAYREDCNIEFVKADLKELVLHSTYDLAVSLFDSLNYILNYKDLKQVFQNVYRLLQDEGLFIFDMNTEKRLMSIEPGTTMLSGKDYTCFWQDIIDQEQKRWQVRLKIYFDQDKIHYFEEFHEEVGYNTEKIKEALFEAGFEHVVIYDAYTFDPGDNNDNRLYFLAFKQYSENKKSYFSKARKKMKWKLIKPFTQLLTGSK